MNFGWIDNAGHHLGSLLGGFVGAGADPIDHIRQHKLFTIPADLGFLTPEGEITVLSDIIVMTIVASVLLVLFVPLGIRKRKGDDEIRSKVPRGPATVLETICWGLRELLARPLLGKHTDRFIPFIWTVFFFILTINVLGLLPFGALSAKFGTHIGGTATANIWTTATLALVTLVLMVFNGLRFGGMDYLGHFNPVPKDMHWGAKLFLVPLMVIVEVLGTFFKIFALAIRLFANMVAGHVLLAVLVSFVLASGAYSIYAGLGMAAIVVPASAAITLLEIFVAFLQAFIFTFLSVLFLSQSVILHHGEEHGEAH